MYLIFITLSPFVCCLNEFTAWVGSCCHCIWSALDCLPQRTKCRSSQSKSPFLGRATGISMIDSIYHHSFPPPCKYYPRSQSSHIIRTSTGRRVLPLPRLLRLLNLMLLLLVIMSGLCFAPCDLQRSVMCEAVNDAEAKGGVAEDLSSYVRVCSDVAKR